MINRLLICLLMYVSHSQSVELVPGDTIESGGDTVIIEKSITSNSDSFSKLKNKFFGKNWDKISDSPDIGGAFSSDAVGEMEFETLEDKVIVTLEIPGTSEQDIDIQVKENSIMITAEMKVETIQKDSSGTIVSKSTSTSSFSQSQTLPAEVIPKVQSTSYENGVLKIELKRSR